MRAGLSLSGHERNCAFLNTGDGSFITASGVSGFDMPDDARSIALCDWDQDGRMDAWTSARNAPQLRFLHNELQETGAFLSVRLQGGGPVNRDAIGTRVEVHTDSTNPLVQTLRAGEGFLSQSEKALHFGLGRKPSTPGKVAVVWPDGKRVEFDGLQPNARYALRYPDQLAVQPPPEHSLAWSSAKSLTARPFSSTGAMRLIYPIPLPDIKLSAPNKFIHVLGPREAGNYYLLNLWNPSCEGCVEELEDFSTHASEIEKAGIKLVVALGPGPAEMDEATSSYQSLQSPFPFGQLSAQDADLLDTIIDATFGVSRDLVLPTSLLIGPGGTLQAVYLGAVTTETLLEDVQTMKQLGPSARERSALLADHDGQWQSIRPRIDLMFVPLELMKQGRVADADVFIRRHSALLTGHQEFGRILIWIGDELKKSGKPELAMGYYLYALQNGTSDPLVMNNVAWQLATNPDPKMRNGADAAKWAGKAVELTNGRNPSYLDTLAAAYAEVGDFDRALRTIKQALDVAEAAGATTLLPSLKTSQSLYRARQPYRDK